MEFSLVHRQNPWWTNIDQINFDMYIKKFENSNFKHVPSFMSELEKFKEGIYVLRGPRQIGKTTLLKLLIRRLIETGRDPLNILYVSLDMVKDNNELLKLLLDYFAFLESFNKDKKEKTYIFLDEISSVKNWQTTIKHLYDTGLLENSFVILTGSSSYDLKNSSERLPGRRSSGTDLVYLPVTFREFIEQKYKTTINYKFSDLLEIDEASLKRLTLQLSMYKNEFTTYLNSGGFPKVINDYLDNSLITLETINTYRDYLYGDIERFNKSRFVMNQLLFKIPQLIGQRFSWNSLAGEIEGINSKNTVEDYIQLLGMNFLFGTLFFYDFSKKIIKPKKQKKIYPIDVIISKVIENITGQQLQLPLKIEQIVFSHLLRFSKDFSNGLVLYSGPYFWYSQKGKEIDFLIEVKEKLIPIEVKYQNKISPSDFSTMKRIFKSGILITKNTTFKIENITALPIEMFLLLI